MDCIFCKIINKDIPSYTVYEDELIKIFLDVNPISNGHSLIVPKKHYTDINDIDLELLTHIQKTVKDLFPIYKEKLNCDGLTLCQNNEYGQEVKHYHLHMIPRYENDGINFKTEIDKKDPKEIYEILK